MENASNLRVWEQDGHNLLIIQPFMDSLIVRGEGCHLIDVEGRRILDLAGGQFCCVLGHDNSRFKIRLQQQIEKIVHLGDQYVSPDILKAATRLAEIAPGKDNRVIFLSTGSEANECAMRIAKTVTQRTGMLAFTRGYYGISLATRSLSSISDYPGKVDFQPAPISQFKILTPTCSQCPIGLNYPSCNSACLDVSLEMNAQHLENIAAIIVEPVVSAGGMIFPPRDYLRRLWEKAHSIGALFIVDEAQTGFGRCGQWFDIQNFEIEPDILVVSKTAGNGYPAAAVVVSNEVARMLETQGFSHLSSHQNDPLAAAAVHAVIDIVEEEKLIEHSHKMGTYFVDELKRLQQEHPLISDVRGRGLMIGLELSERLATSRNLAFSIAMMCELKGLHITFTYYEPVLRFIPPLIISKKEIDFAISILDEVLGISEECDQDLSKLVPKNAISGPFTKRMMGEGYSAAGLVRKMWNTSPRQWVDKVKRTIENE